MFKLKVNLLPYSRNSLNAVPLYMVLHCDSIIVSYNSFAVDRNSIVVNKNFRRSRQKAPKLQGGGTSCRTNLGCVFQNAFTTCSKKIGEGYFENDEKKTPMCDIEIFTHLWYDNNILALLQEYPYAYSPVFQILKNIDIYRYGKFSDIDIIN